MTTTADAVQVDRLYDVLAHLEQRLGGARHLADCTAGSGWPEHGVYFFFEPGELRRDGTTPRIVRVGTHALARTSTTTLWQRLSQHRGHLAGRTPGGGNHRGSIFRHHVGTALLNTGNWPPSLHQSWRMPHVDQPSRRAEAGLELAVSRHIGAMPLLWLAVPDRHDRRTIETGAIALLSNRNDGGEPPTHGWLGRHADSQAVRTSGLWNVRDVDAYADPNILALIEKLMSP
jgi:hypothetical protein